MLKKLNFHQDGGCISLFLMCLQLEKQPRAIFKIELVNTDSTKTVCRGIPCHFCFINAEACNRCTDCVSGLTPQMFSKLDCKLDLLDHVCVTRARWSCLQRQLIGSKTLNVTGASQILPDGTRCMHRILDSGALLNRQLPSQ